MLLPRYPPPSSSSLAALVGLILVTSLLGHPATVGAAGGRDEVDVVDGVVEFGPGATPETWNRVLRAHEFLFVNFFAGWCRFSRALEPRWREAAQQLRSDGALRERAAFASVDCDADGPLVDVCRYYGVNKYPTMTLFKNGIRGRGAEFRGSRSPEALIQFLAEHSRTNVEPLPADAIAACANGTIEAAENLIPFIQEAGLLSAGPKDTIYSRPNPTKVIFGFFSERLKSSSDMPKKVALPGESMLPYSSPTWESEEEKVFQQVSSHFLDGDCLFFTHRVNPLSPLLKASVGTYRRKGSKVVSYDTKESVEARYEGPPQDFISLLEWVKEQCVPLVRELRFNNAEALTEEGLPFLVLFKEPGDDRSLEDFVGIIKAELMGERDRVNFLHADGSVFNHPLEHLSRTRADLPVVAVDNFVHVFGLPKGKDFRTPGVLKTFLEDLYSGKLHLDYHQRDSGLRIFESVFRKLVPSGQRYSLLVRDEL